jgi:hypothetical protein
MIKSETTRGLTEKEKERVTNLTSRVVLLLQERNFTGIETKALIKCLEGLLNHQLEKHRGDSKNENANLD